jgi:hypothetical protein
MAVVSVLKPTQATTASTPYGVIVRLMILTGQHRCGVAGTAWGEISDDLSTWSMPGERSKNGIPHVLPLKPALDKAVSDARAKAAAHDRSELYPAGANGLRTSAASSSPSGTGEAVPITAARRMYSPIASRPTPTDRAITRALAPQAYLTRKTCRTFRIDDLLPGVGPPVARIAKVRTLPSSDRRQHSPPHPINRVAAFVRWPLCLRFRALYVGYHET